VKANARRRLRRSWRAIRRVIGRTLPPETRAGRSARRLRDAVGTSVAIARTHREPCLVYRSRHGYWVHRYREGATVTSSPRVGPTIRQLEERARDYFLQEYVPRPGDVVVDVGAGWGAEVHLFSRLIGAQGRLYAIEAHPRTHRQLERLCAVNRASNVETACLAITGSSGEIVISDSPKRRANTVVGSRRGRLVPTQTLDAFIEERGINRIDFLKMNIEGAERQAIAGMAESIRRTVNVCICCHDFLADRPGGSPDMRTKQVVEEFLVENGFEIVGRDQSDRRPWARDFVYGRRPPAHADGTRGRATGTRHPVSSP
jgi:FkbM family methyltransferase